MKDENKTKKQLIAELEDMPRESEGLFRAIFDNVRAGIALLDMTGRVIKINKRLIEVGGRTEDEVAGKRIKLLKMFTPPSIVKMLSGFAKIVSGQHIKPFEVEVYTKQGEKINAEIHGSPFRKRGKVIGAVAVMRDITERKQVEEALRESEERLRQIADNVPDLIWAKDLDDRFIFVNQAMCDKLIMCGTQDEAIGKTDMFFAEQEKKAGYKHSFGEICVNSDAITKERKAPGRFLEDGFVRGKYLVLDVHKAPFLNKDGEMIGTVGCGRDVTKEKITEDALKENEEKYRLLAETARDNIIVFDLDGRITYTNNSALEISGYSKEQTLMMNITDVLPADQLAGLKERFARRIAGDKEHYIYESAFIDKSGKRIPMEISSSLIIKDGKPSGVLLTARDITKRKKMEEELLKSKKLESIGVLAGGIAHDYNNLLTAIIGNISLAQSYLKPDDQAFELLSEAQKASMGAKDLTQKLITFSKGGTPIKKPAPISPLLKNTTELALSGSNIKCEWSIADDLWPIEIDEAQIGQAIHSLVINAREAMSEGGSIYVSAENLSIDEKKDLLLKKGGYVKISIKDQGSGIPDKYLGKIFDPYFSTKERSTQKGMGLGLSICHSIVSKHGGHITAESAPDAGTTFHVYLPASQTQVIEEEAPVTERPMASRGKILVMDDEELVRNVAGQMLTRLGYDVAFAKDGSEAIGVYKKAMEFEKSFDAVILDLTVKGGMGGKETVKKLLEIDSDVKAILSSGYSDDPAMTDFRKHAFCSSIVKPYDIDEMDRVIFEAIKGRKE